MTLLRKIHTRELAKVLTSSIVVCFSRILGRRESPYVHKFFIYANSRSPRRSINVCSCMDSLESALANSLILEILHHCARPQVLSAIIQRIMIAMITVQSFWSVRYKAMHQDRSSARNVVHSHPHFRSFDELRLPRPLGEIFKICGIHDGSLSFCECDITVRFVERLDYFMPRFSWHGSLS
jgi:hypothetical protein